MAKITLDAADIAELNRLFAYSHEHKGLVWRVRPFVNSTAKPGELAGSKTPGAYVSVKFKGRGILAHRLVWAMHRGEFPSFPIDHINGDVTDNRIENLRATTPRLNQQNRKSHREGRLVGTQFKGGRWLARISIDRKKKHLGSFATEAEAHNAYMSALKGESK